MRRPSDWPKLALIFVPLCIVAVDAAVLVHERLRPETEKAIRLVRESISRKESFTVQQYLYATVYHRKVLGDAITIEGWNAVPSAEGEKKFVVDFSFTDAMGRHLATWDVDLDKGTVAPRSDFAKEVSWR